MRARLVIPHHLIREETRSASSGYNVQGGYVCPIGTVLGISRDVGRPFCIGANQVLPLQELRYCIFWRNAFEDRCCVLCALSVVLVSL